MGDNQPNVLFLLSDQHSFRHVSRRNPSTEGEPVDTPHLDSLAQSGVVFDQTYCQAPLCAPSRMSMLTGREVQESGGWTNGAILPSDIPTLPGRFADEGYETCLVGKMHLSGERQFAGFKHRPYGDLTGAGGHQWDPLFDNRSQKELFLPSDKSLQDLIYNTDHLLKSVKNVGETDIPESLLQEHNVLRETVAWIREHQNSSPGQPWFACASFSRPHYPYTAPSRHVEKYWPDDVPSPKVDHEESTASDPHSQSVRDLYNTQEINEDETLRARAGYFACVDYLDELIGELLAILDSAGLLDNTIIVYTSDHGEMAGEHGIWGKNTYHEASARVPLIVNLSHTHSHSETNATLTTPVSLADLFPTLCGLSGIAPPDNLDGRDLSTAIHSATDPTPRPVVCDNFDPQKGQGAEYRMVRKGHYKYVRFGNGDEVFFDLRTDPYEQENIIRDVSGEAERTLSDLRNYVDATLDFENMRAARAQDLENRETESLETPPGAGGNLYHMPDGRFVFADTPLYKPEVVTRQPSHLLADFPEQSDES